MKSRNKFLLALVFLLAPVASSLWASEEEFLPWRSVKVDCGDHPQTGSVRLLAETDGKHITSLEVTAFGRSYKLPDSDLKRIHFFPLDSLQITHEAGYPKLGGHTAHFKLQRHTHDQKQELQNEEAVISISKGKGLEVITHIRKPGM